MSSRARQLQLRTRLAAWSDRVQVEASALAERYRDLLPRRITNAQLSGLTNIVQAVSTFAEIEKFVTHQGQKAARAGRADMQEYWPDVGKALEELRREAERMWTETPGGPAASSREARNSLDEFHCRLAREFVQHLVAHSLFLGRQEEKVSSRPS